MPRSSTPRAPVSPRRRRGGVALDLALQGGGSHGAFTWGVLDRLLEDTTLEFDGISGTSAGALNAAVLATGWADGGRAGAQAALRDFWLDVAEQGTVFGGALDGNNPWTSWTQQFFSSFSPYQFNPFDLNPLRDVLHRHVRVPALQTGPLSLFIAATAVQSGQPRIFDRNDLSIDALLASACLPQLFRSVIVDGEPYWDGGYSGNPAIWPLIYNTDAIDVLLVKINPLQRTGLPETPAEIADRVNEITFNAGLVAEMRAIGFVQRLVREKHLKKGQYKDLRLHMIADEQGLGQLHSSSKLRTDRAFLEHLHALGRGAAGLWLEAHRADIGHRSTMDPAETFLAPRRPAP